MMIIFKKVLLVCDVLYNVSWAHQSLCITIRYLKPKFIFHGHDDFYVVKTVQSKIIHEVWLQGQLVWVNFVIQTKDEHDPIFDHVNAKWCMTVATMVIGQSNWRDSSGQWRPSPSMRGLSGQWAARRPRDGVYRDARGDPRDGGERPEGKRSPDKP